TEPGGAGRPPFLRADVPSRRVRGPPGSAAFAAGSAAEFAGPADGGGGAEGGDGGAGRGGDGGLLAADAASDDGVPSRALLQHGAQRGRVVVEGFPAGVAQPGAVD